MSIPLLEYAPTTQNSRIKGYEVPGDEQPRVFSTDNLLSSSQIDVLIEAAYRQIFFHAFASDRERFLDPNSAADKLPSVTLFGACVYRILSPIVSTTSIVTIGSLPIAFRRC